MMAGYNVRNYGDTWINRQADRVERFVDLLIPLMFALVFGLACVGLIAGVVYVARALL